MTGVSSTESISRDGWEKEEEDDSGENEAHWGLKMMMERNKAQSNKGR